MEEPTRSRHMTSKSMRKQLARRGNPVIPTLTDALALAHGQGATGLAGVDAALDAIHARIDTRWGCREDVRRLSPGERGLLLTRGMLDEVHNGGIHQYLWNSAGDDAEELRGFLHDAGMEEAAGFLDQVAELFPDRHIPGERALRQARLEEIEDAQASPTSFDQMSRRLVALSPAFSRALLRYVQEHPEEFAQPSDDLVRQGIHSRRVRELQGVQVTGPALDEMQAVATVLERMAAEVTAEHDRSALGRVRQLLAAGRKPDAIRAYRERFPCSLPEAKEAVERLAHRTAGHGD